MSSQQAFVPLSTYRAVPEEEMELRAGQFAEEIYRRRTVRHFSDRPVSRTVIEQCIRAAGSAPSGAHMQPWHFVAVSDAEIKRRIREAAESEEKEFYEQKATPEWLRALAPLGTDWRKPFLEIAPWLIVIFERKHGVAPDGSVIRHYYTKESVGIATGMLITAVHNAGLVSLTHTPNPMSFLNHILGRPDNERAFLILVVGHPAPAAMVPDLKRKALDEISTFV
jgi:nitroreductase